MLQVGGPDQPAGSSGATTGRRQPTHVASICTAGKLDPSRREFPGDTDACVDVNGHTTHDNRTARR
jgi:hypothetical protein